MFEVLKVGITAIIPNTYIFLHFINSTEMSRMGSLIGFVGLVVTYYSVMVSCSRFNCTIGTDLDYNYVRSNKTVYDIDSSTTILFDTRNVSDAYVATGDFSYLTRVYTYPNNTLALKFTQLDETLVDSQSSQFFTYDVTIRLRCMNGGGVVDAFVRIPITDTNTFAPYFEKPLYTYDLISTELQDFERLLNLHPIIAIDSDFTNTALNFSVPRNDYFDIAYNGVVFNSKNKRHYAKLLPKTKVSEITRTISLNVSVTDSGLPRRSGWVLVTINPPSPPTPTFLSPFYIGDYFTNRTLIMRNAPELREGVSYYKTTLQLKSSGYSSYFRVRTTSNGTIELYPYLHLDDIVFYKNNNLIFTLEATYQSDSLYVTSSGSTAVIIQIHHDLL